MMQLVGPLSTSNASDRVLYAYTSWKNQRARCRGKKQDPTYSGRGFSVEYSAREFVQWFLTQTTDGDYKYIVGRIDHSKGYSFDNIQLETRSESSKEIWDRGARKRRLISVIDKKTNKEIKVCKSIKEAMFFTGLCAASIVEACQKHGRPTRRKGSGFLFKYLN